jgi:hypothetical protein
MLMHSHPAMMGHDRQAGAGMAALETLDGRGEQNRPLPLPVHANRTMEPISICLAAE